MGIDIVRLLGVGSVNQNYSINSNRSYRVSFGETLNGDTFQSTTINRYTSESAIIDMIKKNPEISRLLKKESVPLELNIKGLKELLNTHGADTRDTAAGIIANLPFGLKDRVNPQSVKDAAYLHDLGKVLIPKEILYKEGKLSPKETNIMHLHSELGYQIVSVADKYSALREKRPYKPQMTKEQALTIIYKDVADGKLHPFIFKALVDYANSLEVSVKQTV